MCVSSCVPVCVSLVVYLLLAGSLHLSQLGVHELLHRLDLRPHLLLGRLQLVLQLADQRLAAAAVQRGLGMQEVPGRRSTPDRK